ncbi:ParB/RepB/Spo0J family partition protein [Oscillospiraceae bacterium LTW-04]|nr:ParB/RepB/Spo0J family partition protein [Oscillospiraceae bacterium MB24-C1]
MGFLPLLGNSFTRVRLVPLDSIDTNPAQPRQIFEQKALEELALSIKENGLISPILIRKKGDRFQLIAGERRLKAFKMLGETSIPALLEEADDRRSAALAIIENMQRKDLTFFEEAQAIELLIKTQELTQQQAAERLGLSQSAIANKLRLLRLPKRQVDRLILAGLTERHARALLPLCGDARLEEVVTRLTKERPTVTQTEKLIEGLQKQQKLKQGGRILILKDLRLFTSTIRHAVEVMKQAGIEAKTEKIEDEKNIIYTIIIPKASQGKNISQRSQTPPLRSVL